MAILRVIAVKDATGTAQTSCANGTIYDVGGWEPTKKQYAALHILSSSTGGLKVRVQTSSSSAGGGMADRFAFTCSAQRTAEWMTPLTCGTATSTDRKFARVVWEMTTSGESYRFLTLFQPAQ